MTPPSKGTISLTVLTQATGAALSVAVLPLAARSLGLASFALLGIAATVQAWVFVVDGCNLMTRFVAQFAVIEPQAGPKLVSYFRVAERFYLWLMLIGAAVSLIIGLATATHGGNRGVFSPVSIVIAILLIGLCALVKLSTSFYRGCLVGLSEIRQANFIALFSYVLRFPLPYLVSRHFPSISIFLSIQLLSFVIEGQLLRKSFLHRLAAADGDVGHSDDKALLLWPHRGIIVATFALAGLTALSGQLDKVLLAAILPLQPLGAASLAIMLCAGLFVIATPVYQAYLPSLARDSSSAFLDMMTILAIGSSAVACTVISTAVPAAELLIGKGSPNLKQLSSALALYGTGNCLSVLCSGIYFSYFVEDAIVRYQRLIVRYLCGYVPVMILAGLAFGLTGTGCAWLAGNAGLLWMLARDRLRGEAKNEPVVRILKIAVVGTALLGALEWLLDQALANAGQSDITQVVVLAMVSGMAALAALRVWRH